MYHAFQRLNTVKTFILPELKKKSVLIKTPRDYFKCMLMYMKIDEIILKCM